jgi:hypothetical protein
MTITLPVTTGTDGTLAFAHTGPNAQTGLYVAEPVGGHPTAEDAIEAAVAILQDLITRGYLPAKHSRQGSSD